MKQNLFPVFIAIILIYLPAKVLAAEISDTEPTPACESSSDTLLIDSLLTEDHLYEFTFSNFDLACRIINEMRARKKLAPHRLDIAEGDLYYNTEHYRRALKYYQRALQSDSVRLNDEELMGQYHRMISCYDGLNDDTNKAIYQKAFGKSRANPKSAYAFYRSLQPGKNVVLSRQFLQRLSIHKSGN